MHTRFNAHLSTISLLLALSGMAQAASLTLVPSATTVEPNSAFTVDLVFDATDVVISNPPGRFGGKLVISFDTTLLSYSTPFALTAAPGCEGANPPVGCLDFFSDPVVATNGSQQTVTFGFDYATASQVVGQLGFTAIGAPGMLATIGLEDFFPIFGTFFAYTPTNQRIYPAFAGTQVGITAIPLPAGIWLLGTAIGGLAFRAQRRRAAARG